MRRKDSGSPKTPKATIAIDRDIPIKVLTDCQKTVSALRGGQTKSSLGLVDKFWERRMLSRDNEVKLILSHSKIRGNEMAERLAKSALQDLPAESGINLDPSRQKREMGYTWAALNRYVKERSESLVKLWWGSHRPRRSEEPRLIINRKRPPPLRINPLEVGVPSTNCF